MHGSDYCYPSTSLDQDLNSEQEILQGGELLLLFCTTAVRASQTREQDAGSGTAPGGEAS